MKRAYVTNDSKIVDQRFYNRSKEAAQYADH